MDKKKLSRNNLAFNIVSAVLLLILVFSIIVSLIGSDILTEIVNRSYGDAAYATRSGRKPPVSFRRYATGCK